MEGRGIKKKRKFRNLLNDRRKEFKKQKVPNLITQYVIENFRDGNSLEWEDLGDLYIDMFLIDFPDMERAYEESIEKIEDIHGRREWLFIIGDYGSGKTQLKNRIMEGIQKSSRHHLIVSVPIAFYRDSFADFAKRFISKTKELVTVHHCELYTQFEPEFSKFQDDLSDFDKARLITKMIEKFGKKIKFVFNFDELDQVPDTESFKSWADFIVSLHTYVKQGFLGIFFITQREISRFWDKDDRLRRLDSYYQNPYEVGFAQYEKIPDVFTNIIVLYEEANDIKFENNTIDLFFAYLNNNRDSLKSMKIRPLNILIYLLCDILDRMQQDDIWKQVEGIKKLDKITRGQKAEQALKKLLAEIPIDFTLFDVLYSAQYIPQIKEIGNYRSDGQIVLSKRVGNIFEPESELPVEIKFTSEDRHEASQLKEVQRIAQINPTVLLSVGAGEKGIKDMNQRLAEELSQGKLLMLNIDSTLFKPIFAVADSDDTYMLRMTGNWLRQISRIREKVQVFLESHTKENIITDLKEQMKQLADGRTGNGEDVQFAILEVGNAVIGLFDGATRKFKNSLEKQIVEALTRLGTSDIPAKVTLIPKIVNHLITKGFLKPAPKSYGKTNIWDKDKALASLKTLS